MPYLPHTPPVHDSEEVFDESQGIDILIDQIRFPPTNCTIIKICVRIVDKGFKDLIKPAASIPKFDSEVPLPVYNFRIELRKEMDYQKTSFLFLVYVTMDQSSVDGQPGILGYSFFPLFLDKETGEPATDDTKELLLHNGHYQIPVYCQDYPYKLDFDLKESLKLERYPCCTTLIRVLKPAQDPDGQPMGMDDTEKSEDEEKVWPKFLSYRENHPYCNKYISLWPNEDVKT